MKDHHDYREMSKSSLEFYLLDLEFPNLEDFLKDAINSLHKELSEVGNEYEKELNNKVEGENYEAYSLMNEISLIHGRLLSIYEMIIVNDYKEFELVLKELLKLTLDFEEKDFRSFNNLKYLLKDKGINFAEIINYNDMNDLRKVNNYIKHSKISEIPEDLKQISEFRNKEKLGYMEFMNFHRRIIDLRYNFILNLKAKIYSYLYEFDEKRINSLANRLFRRMNKEHVDLLIKKLTELK